jgi:hypothetical protein
MIIHYKKDAVLFRLDTAEMRQVMEEGSMVQAIWASLASDLEDASQASRWIPYKIPLKIFHEEHGRGHVLQCRVHLWRYFREVDAANPLEREIRGEMLTLGLSGEADRRMARYTP